MGQGEREERRLGLGRAALPLVRIGQGEGAAPPFLLLPPLFPPSQVLIQLGKGGGVLLPVGVGLLLARPKAGRTSPL